MDDILWSIAWSAALTPDLHMIPNRIVFLGVAPVPAHRPIREGIEGSLLSRSSAFLECLLATNTSKEVEKVEDEEVEKVEDEEVEKVEDTALEPAWQSLVDELSGGEGDSYAITTCPGDSR